jgi:hypothetical protein
MKPYGSLGKVNGENPFIPGPRGRMGAGPTVSGEKPVQPDEQARASSFSSPAEQQPIQRS